jgi:hypothetical protein
MLSSLMTRPPKLYGCHPEQSEGSAFLLVSVCPSLHPSPRFFVVPASFPILVLFVFNSLRTLLQLGGGGGWAPIFQTSANESKNETQRH